MFCFHSSILWWRMLGFRVLGCSAGRGWGEPPRKGRGSANKSGCCGTRPFFAAQKIGTRTVLAESPTFVCYARRGLIFSRGLPPAAPSDRAIPIDASPQRDFGLAYLYRDSGINIFFTASTALQSILMNWTFSGGERGIASRNVKGQRRGSGGRQRSALRLPTE